MANQRSFLRFFIRTAAISFAAFLAEAKVVHADTTPKHPNVQLIERYYAAYAKGDIDYLKRNIFAPNIVWKIPGHHPLAGDKHGVDEVVAFFSALKKANFKAETYFLEANDKYVIDMHRGWSEYQGLKLDLPWCLVFKIENGKIVEAQNFVADQHAADAFFNAVYKLKPLPDRLAE